MVPDPPWPPGLKIAALNVLLGEVKKPTEPSMKWIPEVVKFGYNIKFVDEVEQDTIAQKDNKIEKMNGKESISAS